MLHLTNSNHFEFLNQPTTNQQPTTNPTLLTMVNNDDERSDNSVDQTSCHSEPRGNFVEPEDQFTRDDESVLTNASSVRAKSKDDMTASKMETFADIITVAFVKAN